MQIRNKQKQAKLFLWWITAVRYRHHASVRSINECWALCGSCCQVQGVMIALSARWFDVPGWCVQLVVQGNVATRRRDVRKFRHQPSEACVNTTFTSPGLELHICKLILSVVWPSPQSRTYYCTVSECHLSFRSQTHFETYCALLCTCGQMCDLSPYN